jgi:hypothetical protein
MSDEIRISVDLVLDGDGFLRRECPRCERQFKWFVHGEASGDAEVVEQYFCPLCGEPSGTDSWWTPDQIEHAQRSAGPEVERMLQSSLTELFKGVKGLSYKPNSNLSLDIPIPDPADEPSDMTIIEPPCHPHEPVKVPDEGASRAFCLVCGSPFAT